MRHSKRVGGLTSEPPEASQAEAWAGGHPVAYAFVHPHRLCILLAVAAANAGNPLLQMRGNAGSHDMELGAGTLRALRGATSAGARVPIPRCAVQHRRGPTVQGPPAHRLLACLALP